MKKFLDALTKRQVTAAVLAYVIAATALILHWQELVTEEKLGYGLFLTLCVHQLEEYVFPGGFVWGLNAMFGSPDPMRWPGDRLSAGLCDWIATGVGLYLTLFHMDAFMAVFFAVIGFAELLVHTVMGFTLRHRLKDKVKTTIYVPGTATCWLLFAPLSIAAMYLVVSGNLLPAAEIGKATLYSTLFLGLSVSIPVLLLQDKNSTYTYANLPGFYKKYLK